MRSTQCQYQRLLWASAAKNCGCPVDSRWRLNDAALLVHIKAVHAASKGKYGWPRIWRELRANSVRVWKEWVRRLMKIHGIKARGKRKFVVTNDSKHNLPIASNLLNRNFQPDAPNRVWASDITYIQTETGWCIWRLFLICIVARLWVGACNPITTTTTEDCIRH